MICVVTAGPAQAQLLAQLDRLTGSARSMPLLPPDDTGAGLRELQAVLATADEGVLLVSGHVLLHDEAVSEMVLDPRQRTAAAVSGTAGTGDVRRRGGQIVSAGSIVHTVSNPDATFVGLLGIARGDLPAAARAAAEMASAVDDAGGDDPVGYVLVALVRSGIQVAAVDIDPWPWAAVATQDDVRGFAARAVDVDVPATKLARALRPDDGFYSTFVIRRLSRRLTPLALRLGLRPNHITVASLVIGIVAATSFAMGGRSGLVAGALLLQLSLVVDCVDGEVARYTRAFTSLGAWLDASTDRVKEYACYAGLALGATRGTGIDIWLLAAAMLSLQTTRHTTDYTFTLVKNVREGAAISVPLSQRLDDAGDDQGSAALRAVRASERGNQKPHVRWAKKAIYLPIGERWLVISVAAAFGSAYWVFGALLTLACVALVYTTAARVLRARTWLPLPGPELERQVVRAQLDRGPLGSAVARVVPWSVPAGRYAWSLPPLLRALEFSCVLVLVRTVAPEAMPAAFAFLFVVAYHHYDALYRVLNGLVSAGALRAAGLGVEGRLLVLAVLAAAGAEALARGLVVLTVVLGVLFVGVGTAGGISAMRQPQRTRAPGRAVGV